MTKQEFDKHFLAITPKPRQVILQVLQGKKDDEIATEMQAAVTTIRKHIENLCDLFEIPSEIDGIKRRRRDVLIALFLEYRPDLVNAEVSIAFPKMAEVSKPEVREREFWQERIDFSGFIGRAEDLEALRASVLTDKCRLVGIQGLPGIGKTFLAAKFAEENRDQFDYLIWRSLNESTNFADLVKYWLEKLAPEVLEANSEVSKLIEQLKEQYEEIKKLSPKEVTDEQKTAYRNCANQLLDHLLYILRNHRCLLILDNFDQILMKGDYGDFAGDYEPHDKPYGLLLQRLGNESNESCLLVLSREKPREFLVADNKTKAILLNGLEKSDALKLLIKEEKVEDKKLKAWNKVIEIYDGNPLALKMFKSIIDETWGDRIDEFIDQGNISQIVLSFNRLIRIHLSRLSSIENELLNRLIDENKEKENKKDEGKTISELLSDDVNPNDLTHAIISLTSRCLIKNDHGKFTVQSIVKEFMLRQKT